MNFEVERLYRDSETLEEIKTIALFPRDALAYLIDDIEYRDHFDNEELLESALSYLEVLLQIKDKIQN